MKTYLGIVAVFLFLGQIILSGGQSKEIKYQQVVVKPKENVKTFLLQNRSIASCVDCEPSQNTKLIRKSGQFINWQLVKSKFSFFSLATDDRVAILQDLEIIEQELKEKKLKELNAQTLKSKSVSKLY